VPQRIFFEPAARRELRAIDQLAASRILDALTRLIFLGDGDVKKLQGLEPPQFRLRVGEYRVRYRRSGDEFYITAIRKRGDAYR